MPICMIWFWKLMILYKFLLSFSSSSNRRLMPFSNFDFWLTIGFLLLDCSITFWYAMQISKPSFFVTSLLKKFERNCNFDLLFLFLIWSISNKYAFFWVGKVLSLFRLSLGWDLRLSFFSCPKLSFGWDPRLSFFRCPRLSFFRLQLLSFFPNYWMFSPVVLCFMLFRYCC